MKVYKKINELKGTNAAMKEIEDWAYSNKICPLEFEVGLELDREYPTSLRRIAVVVCTKNNYKCSLKCCEEFLNMEIK